MKQLLHTFEHDNIEYFVVALNEQAFVGSFGYSSLLFPLKTSGHDHVGGQASSAIATHEEAQEGEGNLPAQQIQAVAGCVVTESSTSTVFLYCAVAKQSKQLLIYRLDLTEILAPSSDQLSSPSPIPSPLNPVTVHQAPKRVSRMMFAGVPSSSAAPPLPVLITGDLSGDAFAYSLTEASTEVTAKEAVNESRLPHRRLLLGHTASMLTSVAMLSTQSTDGGTPAQYILTADRDEKIRVTAFPSTFDIHGFLFGHTSFITCMTVADQRCFSCGGDYTLRMWDCLACAEMASLNLQSGLTKFQVAQGVPCDICINSVGDLVAVIYDRSFQLDLFDVKSHTEVDSACRIVEHLQIILPGQPLGVANVGSQLIVLLAEPHYIQCYNWKDGSSCDLPESLHRLKQQATDQAIALPKAILERDPNNELKLAKNAEIRNLSLKQPWNDAHRKEVNNQKRLRMKQRRRNKKQKTSDMKDDEQDYEQDDEQDYEAVISEGVEEKA